MQVLKQTRRDAHLLCDVQVAVHRRVGDDGLRCERLPSCIPEMKHLDTCCESCQTLLSSSCASGLYCSMHMWQLAALPGAAGSGHRQDGVALNDYWQQGAEERTRGVGLGAGRVAGLDDLVDLLDVVAGALEGLGHNAAVFYDEIAQHLRISRPTRCCAAGAWQFSCAAQPRAHSNTPLGRRRQCRRHVSSR